MMYDVFLSCTSTDVKIAERLSDYLEYYNITTFVANSDIPEDVPWAQGIAEAIRNSRMMIAIYSEDYNSGTWMDGELQTAVEAGIPILTFRLSNIPYGETKADILKSTLYVDATDDIEGKFIALYEEVCNLLGMPIELAQPASEILADKEPLKVTAPAPSKKEEKPAQKDEKPSVEMQQEKAPIDETSIEEEEPVKKVSHSLWSAVIYGLLITAAMVLFLEWVLK
jgi:hypothetical protein